MVYLYSCYVIAFWKYKAVDFWFWFCRLNQSLMLTALPLCSTPTSSPGKHFFKLILKWLAVNHCEPTIKMFCCVCTRVRMCVVNSSSKLENKVTLVFKFDF